MRVSVGVGLHGVLSRYTACAASSRAGAALEPYTTQKSLPTCRMRMTTRAGGDNDDDEVVVDAGAIVKGEGLMRQSLRPAAAPGDETHTSKWKAKAYPEAPIDLVARAEPTAIKGDSVRCPRCGEGGEGLGAPTTYYRLLGSTYDNPVVCKYCGQRFYKYV